MQILENVIEENKNGDFPINIKEIIQKYKVPVHYMDFEWIRGLCIKYKEKWFISINKNCHIYTQRFALAHELAHFLKKETWASSAIREKDDIKEKTADWFARTLLIPEDKLKELIDEENEISTLCKIFWVDKNTIVKRLRDLKININA